MKTLLRVRRGPEVGIETGLRLRREAERRMGECSVYSLTLVFAKAKECCIDKVISNTNKQYHQHYQQRC
jgi:hypothetical protein